MRVLVIAGGNSQEREVSLRSGVAVAAALTISGHKATLFDPAKEVLDQKYRLEYDVAFPVVHGSGGEDGSLQEHLEAMGLPYVGSEVAASRLCFDKSKYRHLLAEHDFAIPAGTLISERDMYANPLFQVSFVLKPYAGGSSVDTFIVRSPETADWDNIRVALKTKYNEMLLEELVAGTEITVAILGTQPLPVIEIIPPENGEFDYENKYNGTSQELCPPQHVPEDVQQAAQDLALQIHKLTGCRHYSRTDMIVRPDDSLVVLETNTLPGMTEQSLFPKAAVTAGISMSALCDKLVQLAATA